VRRFLSPGERELLDKLPFHEAAFLGDMIETFDAHLVPGLEPMRAPKENESQQDVLRRHRRLFSDTRGEDVPA
jgi:hypothetical protein